MKSKLKTFFLAISLYLFTYALIYLVHINFFRVNVIFYSALLDSFIALIIFLVCFVSTRVFKKFSNSESCMLFLILLLVGYSFSISLPTVIDRSLSFYFLEKIKQHDGAINRNAMSEIFINDYMIEYKLVEMRLTEQLRSGTIEMLDDCIVLTKRGYLVTKFSSFFRRNFLANKRLILDEYSDQLTDPLQNSLVNTQYLCDTDE
jgi:hypothetical protein